MFSRLISGEHRTSFKRDVVKSESVALDALLGGGIGRGSSVLVLGPAGTGKSLLALTFAEAAVKHPDLPVLLTSGYSHVLAEEGRHGFELIHKPYAAEELSRVLRRLTQRQAKAGDQATS